MLKIIAEASAYLRTYWQLLKDPIRLATASSEAGFNLLGPWLFFGTTFAISAVVEDIFWSIRERSVVFVPSSKWLVFLQVLVFCLLSFLLLGILLRSRLDLGLRQRFGRLLHALLYVVGGPAILYSTLSALFAMTLAFFTNASEPDWLVWSLTALSLAFMFLAVFLTPWYCMRVLRSIYRANLFLTAILPTLFWFVAAASVAIPLTTISESSLTNSERALLQDLRAASIAESLYQTEEKKCGSLADLKKYAMSPEFTQGSAGWIFVWMRIQSEDFSEEMHGYRLTFARPNQGCAVEATPIRFGPETKLSFHARAAGALLNADDKKGGFASPRDKIVRPEFPW